MVFSMQLTFPPGGAFSSRKKTSRIWLRILPIVLEEELKVLDFILWLKYYFVLLGCFPLFCVLFSLL